MSESERAAEIVQQAVQALQNRGARSRASRASLDGLRTTGGSAKATPAKAAESQRQAPPVAETKVAQTTSKSIKEMFAETAAAIAATTTPAKPAKPVEKTVETPASAKIETTATKVAPATGSKAERLAAMKESVLQCVKCPNLVRSRTQVVFGVGNPEAELMFVGEAPGADEDAAGEPFVGKAGQLLTKIIETMGLTRNDVYIANVLKCRPDMPEGESGNRKPTLAEMNTCKPYLLEQIEIIKPKVLVGLGATAMEGLLGLDKFAITKQRGQWQTFAGIPLMPTFHPAYLLRNQALSEKRRVWEDMLAVMEKLDLPISEKQRAYFLAK